MNANSPLECGHLFFIKKNSIYRQSIVRKHFVFSKKNTGRESVQKKGQPGRMLICGKSTGSIFFLLRKAFQIASKRSNFTKILCKPKGAISKLLSNTEIGENMSQNILVHIIFPSDIAQVTQAFSNIN